jgi:hypothetical protein
MTTKGEGLPVEESKKRPHEDVGESVDKSYEALPPKKAQSLVGPPSWSHAQRSGIKFFDDELPKIKAELEACKEGEVVNLPLPPVGGLTSRFTNHKVGSTIPCIQRKAFKDLRDHLDKKEGLIYVNGPEGFGKSFALFCRLSLDDNY